MPTYQYRCTDCSAEHEVVQRFTDDPLTDCPSCDGNLRKVYSAVGVVFKGSGFYATDNRSKNTSSTAATPPSTKSGASSDSGSAPAGSGTTSATSSSSAPSSTAPSSGSTSAA